MEDEVNTTNNKQNVSADDEPSPSPAPEPEPTPPAEASEADTSISSLSCLDFAKSKAFFAVACICARSKVN